VPTNGQALSVFRHHVTNLWRRTLLRRSQKDRITWTRMMQSGGRLARKTEGRIFLPLVGLAPIVLFGCAWKLQRRTPPQVVHNCLEAPKTIQGKLERAPQVPILTETWSQPVDATLYLKWKRWSV
jgi:hypothetical protein